MAVEIQRFAVTIPAGTLKSAPLAFNLSMPPRRITEIEIVIPPGPRGEVGFQLGFGGSQLIPYTAGQFFVTDDEKVSWKLEGMPDSGAWQMIAYNTGTYPHTIEVRFLCELAGVGATVDPAPISARDLSSAPSPAALPDLGPVLLPPPELADLPALA